MTTASTWASSIRSRPAIPAFVALVAALTLLGGPASFALWNDQINAPAQNHTSANGLTLTVTSTTASFSTGATGSTVATSTAGLIPGIRGQRLTYSMAAGAANGVQGYLAGTITASAKTASAKTAWASVYTAGYLTTTAAASGTCAVTPTPSIVGGALTWTITTAPGQTVKPGQTCTIVLDLAIPAVANGVDVSRVLRASRGTNTALNPLADFAANAVLSQVPRAEEKS